MRNQGASRQQSATLVVVGQSEVGEEPASCWTNAGMSHRWGKVTEDSLWPWDGSSRMEIKGEAAARLKKE